MTTEIMTTERQSAMQWYIVRSQSSREKSVAEKMQKEGETGDLMGKIGRVIVPVEKSFHLKNGKKVQREKVMYPGYIFIETNAVGELKYYLKGLSGASGFLTSRGGHVQSLTQAEVDRMLGVQKQKEIVAEQFGNFITGESVKVLEGPFTNFTGTIESVKEQKVKVEVMIFGRKNLIELSSLQIEKHND